MENNQTTTWDDDLDALLTDLAEWDPGDLLAGWNDDLDDLLANLPSDIPLPEPDVDLDSLMAGWDIGDLVGWDDAGLDALLDDMANWGADILADLVDWGPGDLQQIECK